jgi:hypothetical protein
MQLPAVGQEAAAEVSSVTPLGIARGDTFHDLPFQAAVKAAEGNSEVTE